MTTSARTSDETVDKVVINTCYGGFSLSRKATELLAQREFYPSAEQHLRVFGNDWCDFSARDIPRNDWNLVNIVETLGKEANGCFSKLKVVSIPNGVKWKVEEYDGKEWVAEVHRTWG